MRNYRLFLLITCFPLAYVGCTDALDETASSIDPIDIVFTDNWYPISEFNSYEIINQYKSNKEIVDYEMFDSVLVRTGTDNSRIIVIPLINNEDNTSVSWIYFKNDITVVDFFLSIETASHIEPLKYDSHQHTFEQWSGNIKLWGENSDFEMSLSINQGTIDPLMSKCFLKSNSSHKSSVDRILDEGSFSDCMQDAWAALPWWFQIGCSTSCGGCIWAKIPVACGSCAGCIVGMAFHCAFIE